jgi:two-component system KDP operon response regulator KdpE
MMTPQAIVLIVEDEAHVRAFLVDAIRFHGYQALPVGTVQEAEAARQRLGPRGIDLVIANINLTSDMSAREGYALAQRWRAQEPTLPVILISGDPSLQALPEIQTGAMRFLAKPLGLDALFQTVRLALGR